MKKINKFKLLLSVLAFVSMSFIATPARAFLLPPMPWDLTTDFLADPLMIINKVAKGLNKAQTMYNEAAQKANNIVYAAKTARMAISARDFSAISKVFKSKDPNQPKALEIPGVREINNTCELVNVNDVDSVKNGVYQLFLATPSEDLGEAKRYRDYGKKFYQDTLLEVYAASEQLQKKVPELEALISRLPDKLNSGSDGAKPGKDQIAVLENLKVNLEVMDQIMQVQEELRALKAQLDAAKAIQMINPAEFIDPDSYSSNEVYESSVKYVSSELLTFAYNETENYVYDVEKSSDIAFREAPPSPVDSPYKGNEDAIAELEKLEPLYQKAKDTLELHNLIQTMPTYKSIFEEYSRQVRLHEKSVDDLRLSDQCVKDYLGRYYADPEKTWNGRRLGGLVNEYGLRKGLSGWAINAFEVAKAESVDEVDTDSFGTVDISGDLDVDNASNVGDLNNTPDINPNTSGLVNPSKEKDVENNNRETKMLSWNIGAEAAKMLVEDQYSGNSQWGIATKRFSIWTDQKNFYNQYLDGKYDNMKDYVKFIDTRKAVMKLAVMLNQIETDRKVSAQTTREAKNLERLRGVERDKELAKIAALLSSDFEKALGKTANTSEIDTANSVYSTNYAATTRRYKEARKPYDEKTSLSPQEQQELAAINKNYKLDVQDLQIIRDQTINAYQMARVSDNFDDDLNANSTREIAAVADLEAKKVQEISAAVSEKEAALQPLVTKKETLNQILDTAANRLNQYNEEIEKLQEKIQAAKTDANYMKGEIQNTIDYFGEVPGEQITMEETERNYKEDIVVSREKEIVLTTTQTDQVIDTNTKPIVLETETVTTITNEEVIKGNKQETPEEKEDALKANSVGKQAPEAAEKASESKSSRKKFSVDKVSFYRSSEILNFAQQAQGEVVIKMHQGELSEEEVDEVLSEGDDVKVTTTEVVKETTYDDSLAQKDMKAVTFEDNELSVEETLTLGEKEYTEKTTEKVVTEVDLTAEIMQEIEGNINTSTEIIDVEGKNIEELRVEAKKEQSIIDKTRASIDNVDKDIEAIEIEHVNKVSAIEERYANLIDNAIEQAISAEAVAAKNVLSILSVYNNRIDKVLPSDSYVGGALFSQVQSVISKAQSLVSEGEKYAEKLIDDTKEDIYTMEDELYLPHNNTQVVQKHKDLTDKLTTLSVEGLKASSAIIREYASQTAILEVLSKMYTGAMTKVACANGRCAQADELYFVGQIGKAQDFAGPKAPPSEYLPPLREIVHFDDVDYENIPKALRGVTTREAFLSYGGRIPEIWKLILNDKVFVEKGVDLQEILDQGGEGLTLLTGGIFPCNYEGYTVSIDVKQDRYIVGDKADDTYPTCKPIQVGSRKLSITLNGGSLYYNMYDVEGDVSGRSIEITFSKPSDLAKLTNLKALLGFEPKKEGSSIADNTSELGVFLTMENNELRFNDVAYRVFERLRVVGEEASKENSNYKTSLRDEMFRRAQLDTNQIGDFLRFVEREQEMKQMRDELAINVMEIKELLFEALRNVGYEPSEDLDLTNKEDYDLVINKLDTAKNEKIAEANTDMSNVKIANNVVAEERLGRIKTIFTALEKDKNELVSLSEMTQSGSELDEAIKSEEVNKAATDEYSKKADEEMEKQLKNSPRPYCAIY